MLRDSYEAKIIRVDGLAQDEVVCEMYLNGQKFDYFQSFSQIKPVILSSKGCYQVVLKTSASQKSVSFKTSIFQEEGAQWLPLFDSNDYIDFLPDETLAPRFLMVLCKTRNLHTIEESGEVSEQSSLSMSASEEVLSEIKEILNTQEFFESIDSSFMDQSSIKEDGEEVPDTTRSQRLSRIWEEENTNDKVSFDINHQRAFEELLEKYQVLSKTQEVQEKRIAEYDEKFKKILETSKEQMKRSKEREDSLLQLVCEKETEARTVQEEVYKLRTDNRNLKIENARVKANEELLLNQISLSNVDDLVKEVKVLKDLMKSQGSSKITQEKIEEIARKDVVIKELQRLIYHFKPLEGETRDSQESIVMAFDELDEVVKNNAKSMGLTEPLIRDKEQMYLYGNRKLSLMLSNGNLVCRMGASFKPFRQYMESFVLEPSLSKATKKKPVENIDSEYDVFNYTEAQNTLKTASNKFNRTPLARRRTKS